MLALKEQPVFYPESDGKPMAETDVHRSLIMRMIDVLQTTFPDAYVSGNICLYYEEGNPKKMISPDTLLCRAQAPQEKRVYKAWEEDAQLDLVMEFSSFSTRREDFHKKKRLYEQVLRVPYYAIFNPHVVALTVFALAPEGYQQLETDERGHYHLPGLGLQIAVEAGNSLRLFDVEGQPLLTAAELALQQKDMALQQKDIALQQKDAALAEQARLRALLERAGLDPDSLLS